MTSHTGPTMSQEYIASPDGRRLPLRCWRPAAVRAVVAFVHEPGSDGARYDGMAHALAPRGIASYAIDLDEAGGAPGVRRQAPLQARHLAELRTLTTCLRLRHPTPPLFVFGHGAGALTACRHALRYPTDLDGLVGEATLLDPPWRAAIFRKHRGLAHALRVPRMALVRADGRLRETVRALSLPLLLLQGSDDVMAPPSGSEYLHRHAGSRDKTLLVFEGGDHDLVNGRGHRRVREKTGQWIEAQLAPGTRRRIGIEYINEEV